MERGEFLRELESFTLADENWDGHGGSPLGQVVEKNCVELMNKLGDMLMTELDDVCLNPNGTVSFMWSYFKDVLSLELGKTSMSYYTKRDGKLTYVNKIPISNMSIALLEISLKSLIRE